MGLAIMFNEHVSPGRATSPLSPTNEIFVVGGDTPGKAGQPSAMLAAGIIWAHLKILRRWRCSLALRGAQRVPRATNART